MAAEEKKFFDNKSLVKFLLYIVTLIMFPVKIPCNWTLFMNPLLKFIKNVHYKKKITKEFRSKFQNFSFGRHPKNIFQIFCSCILETTNSLQAMCL